MIPSCNERPPFSLSSMLRRPVRALLAFVPVGLALFFWFPAKSSAELQGTIAIEQVSPSSVGAWTFYGTDGVMTTSKDKGVSAKKHAFSLTQFGPVRLSVKPPPGMSSRVLVFRNGTQSSVEDLQQLTLTLYPGDSYRLVIQYAFTRLGSLGVTTTPTGVKVTLKGPGGRKYVATSPYTFTNLPAGKYTVSGAAIADCFASPLYNRNVEPEKRVTLQIDMPCGQPASTAEAGERDTRQSKRAIRQQAEQRELQRALRRQQQAPSTSSSL